MNRRMLIFYISMHVKGDGFYVLFWGVTTWYQSVPGSNTLGMWEVIRITMGLSRLIETLACIVCLCDNMLMCLYGYGV